MQRDTVFQTSYRVAKRYEALAHATDTTGLHSVDGIKSPKWGDVYKDLAYAHRT